MKKYFFKKLGISIFTLSLLISSTSAMANNISEEPSSNIVIENKDIPEKLPRTTYLKVDLDMNGTYNSYTQSWIQTQGFKYTRVYIKNTSNAKIIFELDGGINDSVAPNDEHMFYITNATSGRHYINLEGEYGAKISGWVGVRESDNPNF